MHFAIRLVSRTLPIERHFSDPVFVGPEYLYELSSSAPSDIVKTDLDLQLIRVLENLVFKPLHFLDERIVYGAFQRDFNRLTFANVRLKSRVYVSSADIQFHNAAGAPYFGRDDLSGPPVLLINTSLQFRLKLKVCVRIQVALRPVASAIVITS
jgi:hypothetical protein